MKIIIAGAGDVGFHLAKLLSYESHDIYLIDFNGNRLNYVNNQLDIITHKGDATSIQALKEIGVDKADLLLAVTESQNTNFTIAVLGKQLGANKTIARIENPEFLRTNEIDFTSLGIDSMISPEGLAAEEIKMLLNRSAFNDTIEFEGGILNIVGCTIAEDSPLVGLTVQEAKEKYSNVDYINISITSAGQGNTIIPRGDDVYHANDQLYFSIPRKSIPKMNKLLGKKRIGVKDVMILGGSKIGAKTAKNLCTDDFNIKLIESQKAKAFDLAEALSEVLVIYGDGRDVDLLEEENISEMDAFVAVTGDSETNIMSCLVAKSKGVKKTIALVENMNYINISQTIGIDTLINKKLLAASSIFTHIRQGEVVALANLHNVDAEVLEFVVNKDSKVTKGPIKELEISRKAVFAGVIRNRKAHMTFGDFQIKEKDKVVVFCEPEAISEIESFFK